MSRRQDLVDCHDWRLVITGHSLGAGAAALVALYVHNFFPKCASPPPTLITDANTGSHRSRPHIPCCSNVKSCMATATHLAVEQPCLIDA